VAFIAHICHYLLNLKGLFYYAPFLVLVNEGATVSNLFKLNFGISFKSLNKFAWVCGKAIVY